MQDTSGLSTTGGVLYRMIIELVDYEDDVFVQEAIGPNSIILELTVHTQDVGKVIGKKGRMANALRDYLAGASGKLRKKVILDLVNDRLSRSAP